MKRVIRWVSCVGLVLSFALLAAGRAPAQEKKEAPPSREKLVSAARELIGTLKYCALITIDPSGQPHVRTMNPFPPEEDMSVWMATTTLSRKYREIRQNPRVTLYYANHAEAPGYVAISGRAVLVDDMAEILKRKRAYWDSAFPGLKNLVLIKVVPERLEVVYYKLGLNGDSTTFAAPSVELTSEEPKP
jgi:general stress protein 26